MNNAAKVKLVGATSSDGFLVYRIVNMLTFVLRDAFQLSAQISLRCKWPYSLFAFNKLID